MRSRSLDDGFQVYKIGAPYIPAINRWPEGSEYNYADGQHTLRMFYNRTEASEASGVRRARASFALYARDGVMFLCYRFGNAAWRDAAFHYHLIPPERQYLPESIGSESQVIPLNVFLVEASNGILKAMRSLTLPPHFSSAMYAEIWSQANNKPLSSERVNEIILDAHKNNDSGWIAYKLATEKCTIDSVG